MLVGGAFTLLLFLISGVSPGVVLPPTNVTLNCTNFNVTVSWKYRERQPQTSFRVYIKGRAGYFETETTDHQYDLSHFVWQSEERYLDFYYVTVTAIEGGNQSQSVPSETFTFNKFNYPQKRCALDFPPADLNEKDSGTTVSFVNPLYFYRELKEADKPGTVTFIYNVSSHDFQGALKSRLTECTASQEHCKHDVSFPEGVEKCVNLSGWLNAGNNIGGVVFRKSGRVCVSESNDLHAVALTVMLFVLAIVISVIIIIIYKVRAWTMKTPSLPEPLIPEPQPREQDMRYAHVPREDFSQLTVSQPCKKLSVSSEEENHLMENLDSSAGSGFRHDGLYMEGGLSEEYGRGDDSENSSVKSETDSTGLEEEEEDEEEKVSPYDSPHTVQVDMGDGDMVTGYNTR